MSTVSPMVHPKVGLVLAGGRSSRMGGSDKALAEVGGVSLVRRVVDRMQTIVPTLAINANRSIDQLTELGVPVLPDTVPDYQGPLAGLLTGLIWARNLAGPTTHLVTVPVDCPLFPVDLVMRLEAALTNEKTVAVAKSGERIHPVVGIWPVSLIDDLAATLAQPDQRKVMVWLMRHDPAVVEWPMVPYDPFTNVNTPADLQDLANLYADDLN